MDNITGGKQFGFNHQMFAHIMPRFAEKYYSFVFSMIYSTKCVKSYDKFRDLGHLLFVMKQTKSVRFRINKHRI